MMAIFNVNGSGVAERHDGSCSIRLEILMFCIYQNEQQGGAPSHVEAGAGRMPSRIGPAGSPGVAARPTSSTVFNRQRHAVPPGTAGSRKGTVSWKALRMISSRS